MPLTCAASLARMAPVTCAEAEGHVVIHGLACHQRAC